MQTKTNVLVFSLAAILSLSVVAMGELPQAVADKDHDNEDKKLKFKKKADFTADCYQVNLGMGTNWDCKASFWLDKNGENLKYKIQIDNMDLTGYQTIPHEGTDSDNVTGVHLHDAALDGMPHVLNIWKAPIEDDAQMRVIPALGIIQGIYDDGDVNPHNDHGPTLPLTDKIDDLCDGKFFVMVHNGPGVLKGDAIPTKQGEKLCKKLSS
ncbi:MAG: hypothetical protein OES27_08940 [Nitrosopumilus sp.]|nr:hypothetical protein [Nitrosopumilus sp.]